MTSPMNTPTSSSDRERAPSRTRAEKATDCPICGDIGYVTVDVPVGHPDFGKAIPCVCRQEARTQRRQSALQSMSHVGALTYLTFDAFIPEPTHLSPDKAYNLRRAYETCTYFAQDPDGWLLLTGTYGCGKTHLAGAIANARLAEGKSAVFMVVPDLLDHLRATFSPQSATSYDELFEQLRTAPLLILDDLGTQSSTAWAQEKLFQLLNYRYNARLATVITTNQRLDEIEPRVRSRLQDPSLVNHYSIIAPDFRAGKNPTQSDLSTLAFHREKQFHSFELDRDDLTGKERLNVREVFAVCEHYAGEPRGWLVLSGESGAGKTHLAAAIANRLVASAFGEVMFIVVPDLLDHLRAAFGPNSNTPYDRRFDEIKKASCLVLDDLGTESATPWAREKLYQLLNYRYNAQLPTVITTAHTIDEVEPWLKTRMLDVERCKWCILNIPGFLRSRSGSNEGSTSRSSSKRTRR
jgi:DNA replication protein DnaC